MRSSTPDGLLNPHPLIRRLPGLYQDEPFVQRFLSAFDDVLAPVMLLLDGGFEAHLDPMLVPPDFVSWLGGWVGLVMEEEWPEDRRRNLIANAVDLFRWRGTVRGLAEAVALFTDEIPEILESGGVAWGVTPGVEPPGIAEAQIVVRVEVDDGTALARIERIVALAKPAHLAHRVEAVA